VDGYGYPSPTTGSLIVNMSRIAGAVFALIVTGGGTMCTALAQDCSPFENLTARMGAVTEERERAMRNQNQRAYCEGTRRGLAVLGEALVFMRANVGRCGIDEPTISQVSQMIQTVVTDQQQNCR
jgi:hypothetical protein